MRDEFNLQRKGQRGKEAEDLMLIGGFEWSNRSVGHDKQCVLVWLFWGRIMVIMFW